jgi:hypothetical protein
MPDLSIFRTAPQRFLSGGALFPPEYVQKYERGVMARCAQFFPRRTPFLSRACFFRTCSDARADQRQVTTSSRSTHASAIAQRCPCVGDLFDQRTFSFFGVIAAVSNPRGTWPPSNSPECRKGFAVRCVLQRSERVQPPFPALTS